MLLDSLGLAASPSSRSKPSKDDWQKSERFEKVELFGSEEEDEEEEKQPEGSYLMDCRPQIPTLPPRNSWPACPGRPESWWLVCSSEKRRQPETQREVGERRGKNWIRVENPAETHRFLLVPSSRKPLAKGLWSIFSLVI